MYFRLFLRLNEKIWAVTDGSINTGVSEREDENPMVTLLFRVVIEIKSIKLFFDYNYCGSYGLRLSKDYLEIHQTTML